MKTIDQTFQSACSLICSLLLLVLASSCKKENPIVHTDEDLRLYKLPQGDQPYDQQIVDLYNKYNTVILYNYVDADFSYGFTGPVEANLWAPCAGPNGIQQTLDFFQQHWFSLYADTFLIRNLPFKILLSSGIRKKLEYSSGDTVQLKASAGYRNVAFGLTGKLDNLSHVDIDSARGALHGAFWQQALFNGTIMLPPAFPAPSSYPAGSDDMKKAGTFTFKAPMNAFNDMGDYIQVITAHHKTWLDANLFTLQNDPAGNYKKKYNIIISYYKTTYNIDLQAIGNL
jgi:hypothetical protein